MSITPPADGSRARAARGVANELKLGLSAPESFGGCAREFGGVMASSPAMHEVFDVLERFAPTDTTVTFCGETGVGKDVLAHALHARSRRAAGPLVIFDCGSVVANLAESELLGHERGAFTGAVGPHAGAFERAHHGTLFLDEVGELPMDLQTRLLRALESRRVRRVGGRQDRPVDVRVVAATHRNLRADVGAGRFREDLFFRLAVVVVPVPPLRDRLADLPALVHRMLADLGRPDLHIADAAWARLRAHAWPGNVRELKNALACAVALAPSDAVMLEPKHLRLVGAWGHGSNLSDLALVGQSLDEIERMAIQQTLTFTEGNRTVAARALEIPFSSLCEKIKKHGL